LVGTSGADTLTSTAGSDLLVGGAGADTFSFGSIFGRDVIADFAVAGAAHDIINFQAGGILNSFATVMAKAVQVGTGVVITQDADNVLTLNNVTRTALAAADFSFA
jgi:Ca2+-binding RTX toxin-like protein